MNDPAAAFAPWSPAVSAVLEANLLYLEGRPSASPWAGSGRRPRLCGQTPGPAWGRERPESLKWRHEHRWIRAGGVGGSAAGLHRGRWRTSALDGLRGRLVSAHRRQAQGGSDAENPPVGAPPENFLEGIQSEAVAGARGAVDQRATLRLPAHQRRDEHRAPVLIQSTDGFNETDAAHRSKNERHFRATGFFRPLRRQHGNEAVVESNKPGPVA